RTTSQSGGIVAVPGKSGTWACAGRSLEARAGPPPSDQTPQVIVSHAPARTKNRECRQGGLGAPSVTGKSGGDDAVLRQHEGSTREGLTEALAMPRDTSRTRHRGRRVDAIRNRSESRLRTGLAPA